MVKGKILLGVVIVALLVASAFFVSTLFSITDDGEILESGCVYEEYETEDGTTFKSFEELRDFYNVETSDADLINSLDIREKNGKVEQKLCEVNL